MTCGGIDPHNIYFWCSLAGVLFGGGLSFTAASAGRRSLTAALVFFSLAVAAAAAGLLSAAPAAEELRRVLIWFGCSIAAGYAGFLFWKFIGIPLTFVLLIMISLVYSSVVDWRCLHPGVEICRFSLISQSDELIRVQWDAPGSERERLKSSSTVVAADIDLIELPGYFFLFSSDSLYRFRGLVPADGSGNVAEGGAGDQEFRMFWRRLPGVSVGKASAASVEPVPSFRYIYKFDDGGRAVVSRIIGE